MVSNAEVGSGANVTGGAGVVMDVAGAKGGADASGRAYLVVGGAGARGVADASDGAVTIRSSHT